MAASEKQQGSRFPPIGSLAVIGDGRSLAVLAPDGTLEWFCPARFDAQPLLWSLLDQRQGGYLRIAAGSIDASSMRYLEETAMVEYEWRTADSTARARVGFEWPGEQGQQRILWQISGLEGTTRIDTDFFPQPDFGGSSVQFHSGPEAVYVYTDGHELAFQGNCSVTEEADHLIGSASVSAGETLVFCLSLATQPKTQAETVALASVTQRIDQTASAWRTWSSGIKWTGEYREAVIRSAITLKLLIYQPSGAVVAAGTAGLPESIGGLRNWDYRFTWFRDAGLVLDALHSLGCAQEAHRWADWMQKTMMHQQMPLRVLYTVDGEPPPPEKVLPHVEGYRQSRPVRTGNAADGQFQLDIYGELLECVFICDTMSDTNMRSHWKHLREAADFIAANWREPDHGIWEVRASPQHFTHSKVAAWAGLKRALWLQNRHELECDRERWSIEAAAIEEDVWLRCVDNVEARFKRAYDDDEPDASLLLLARYGFVDGTDAVFQNTVNMIWSKLGVGDRETGLLLRYAQNGGDGLEGEEGAFVICSFWLVDALVRGKRMAEAQQVFEAIIARSGNTYLLAEQIDPKNGEQLGNFPQAFSHVGLINAALQLTQQSLQ